MDNSIKNLTNKTDVVIFNLKFIQFIPGHNYYCNNYIIYLENVMGAIIIKHSLKL